MRIVGCTLAAAFLIAAYDPVTPARARSCPTGNSIIQQSASAVLYESDNVIGCYRRTGERTYLSDVDGGIYASAPYRLAGRFVMTQRQLCDRHTGDCSADLTLWDLASAPANGFEAYAAIDGYASDVELKSNGTFAAIVSREASSLRQVFIYSRSERKPKLVDAGTDIDGASLNRHGKMVRWLNGGQIKIARLR
jgi:hypothetical protein